MWTDIEGTSNIARDATGTSIHPDRSERNRFETKARRYLLERHYYHSSNYTEVVEVPSAENITSHIFEYDLAGITVKGIGQYTGGLIREVVENEAAFSSALEDVVCLYILNRIYSSEYAVEVAELDNIITNHEGWIKFSTLVKGGLIEIIGKEVQITKRALTELQYIFTVH